MTLPYPVHFVSWQTHPEGRGYACVTEHGCSVALLPQMTCPWLLLQDMLSVTGVCQHWRDVGSSLFFSGSNWRGQPDIRHPAQLVTLVSLLITDRQGLALPCSCNLPFLHCAHLQSACLASCLHHTPLNPPVLLHACKWSGDSGKVHQLLAGLQASAQVRTCPQAAPCQTPDTYASHPLRSQPIQH